MNAAANFADEYNLPKVFWVVFVFSFGLLGVVYFILNPVWPVLIFGAVYAYLRIAAVTVLLHRFAAHRSFDMPLWVKKVWAALASGAIQGTGLWWATKHLVHHYNEDVCGKDPHTPRDGFLHSVCLWFLKKHSDELPENVSTMLLNCSSRGDVLRWQMKHHALLSIVMGFVIPMVIGWTFGNFWHGLFSPCLFLSMMWLWTWSVNSIGHTYGEALDGSATNYGGRIAEVATAGESNHALHHMAPGHYRIGRGPGRWDPGARIIECMQICGLAYDLKTPRERKTRSLKAT